jgi:hypothetical protein
MKPTSPRTDLAKNIEGYRCQLFLDTEDIKWALETHVQDPALTVENVTGVIMTGNEDSPEQIWITHATCPDNLYTRYELVYLPDTD